MSGPFGPVANAYDFDRRFGQAVTDYQVRVSRVLRRLRGTMDPQGRSSKKEDENLEAHIRAYVIDPSHSALNWTILENLTIETTIRSVGSGTRRRLDYLAGC